MNSKNKKSLISHIKDIPHIEGISIPSHFLICRLKKIKTKTQDKNHDRKK